MERYLTKKAQKPYRWHEVVGTISALMGILPLVVLVEDRHTIDLELLYGLVVLSLIMFLPLIFIVRWRLRRRKARLLAVRLAARSEQIIPLDRLDGVVGIRDSMNAIKRLTGLGFLREMTVDEHIQCLRLGDYSD